MAELFRADTELNRSWCLESLVYQAAGRHLDITTDMHLIEQLNASVVKSHEDCTVSECKVPGCEVKYLTVVSKGILGIIDKRGECSCQSDADKLELRSTAKELEIDLGALTD